MSSPLKGPKKNAAENLRKFYNTVIRKPLSEQDKIELRQIFRKENQSEEAEEIKPKKIAKHDQDAGLV